MTWLRRVCSVVALAVLSSVSMHGNAYVITANPSSGIRAGDPILVTLSGGLSATALLVVTIDYDPALLSPDLPADPLEVLDNGVVGKSDAFAFYDNQSPSSFDYVVVALTDLSASDAILSIPFTTLAAGPALLTFTTCAATADQDCNPGSSAFAGSSEAQPSGSENKPLFTIQPAANQVPEPSSILLVLSAFILSSVFLRRRKARV